MPDEESFVNFEKLRAKTFCEQVVLCQKRNLVLEDRL